MDAAAIPFRKRSAIAEIFTFWFGNAQAEGVSYVQQRRLWFTKDPEVDAQIRDRFLPLYQQAVTGKLEHWQQSPQGCLALLLLLDQFPRNMFRNTPQAFATDLQALAIAETAIDQGFDQAVLPIQRLFFYLPLEHCEDRTRQQQSVNLFRQLYAEAEEFADTLDYAQRHQAVIDRFGRFPHRNLILNRPSTVEELKFLQQPGSSF